jgi:hypothetical protein
MVNKKKNIRLYYIAIRLTSIAIGVLTGVLSLKILNNGQSSGITYIALMSYAAFSPLLQFGTAKTLFSKVKNILNSHSYSFISSSLQKIFINIKLNIIISIVFFLLISFVISHTYNYNGKQLDLIFFTIGYGSLIFSSFYRDACYAANSEKLFETMDLIRKISLMFGLIFLAYYFNPFVFGIFLLLTSATTCMATEFFIINTLKTSSNVDNIKTDNINTNSNKDNFYYYIFSVNESIFYNFPLLFLTLYPNENWLLVYSLWMKIFNVIILPYRIYSDSFINYIYNIYINKFHYDFWHKNFNIIKLGIIYIIFTLFLMYFIIGYVAHYLKINIDNDNLFLTSLFFWFLGNLIQHPFGTFILSKGSNFLLSLLLSLITLLIVVIIFLMCINITENFNLSIMISGIFYLFSSFLYPLSIKYFKLL